jgi:hypothetical protein
MAVLEKYDAQHCGTMALPTRTQLRGPKGLVMARSTQPEEPAHYAELAKLALWEAERTLDQEAAQSMRALADRFQRRSERSPHNLQRSN